MTLRGKLLPAAAFALFGLMYTAPAAHAAETVPSVDRVQQDFSFVRNGKQLTCTVVASSSFKLLYGDEFGTRAVMSVSTEVSDPDPGCSAAVTYISGQLDWYRRDTEIGATLVESQTDDRVKTLVAVAQVPTKVAGTHFVVFACDNTPAPSCTFELSTSPK